MPSDKVNLLDFIVFILRWRRFILLFVGFIVLCTVVVSLIAPSSYTATATIFPSQEQSLDMSSFVSSKLAGLPGVAGFAAQMGSLPGEIYLTILRSRSTSEAVIDSFDLRKKWKMESAPIEDVIHALLGRATFEYDLTDGTVTIQVTSHEPKMSADMTNFYVRELDRRNQELKSQKAAYDRTFIGGRLEDTRQRLDVLEDSMRSFQERTGVLDVNEQVKATIQTAAELEALRLTTELELTQAREMMQPDNPMVEELERKLAGVRMQMRHLVDREQKSAEDKLLLTLKDAPVYGATYLRLLRDITVQELLYQYLVQQYEQARITEVRHTPTMQAIDWASTPTKRSWPKRGIMVVISAAAAFVFAVAAALVIDTYRKASTQPQHPQHERILTLKQVLKRPKENEDGPT
jgi:tyrosine-protein kinase Etk/Wzc